MLKPVEIWTLDYAVHKDVKSSYLIKEQRFLLCFSDILVTHKKNVPEYRQMLAQLRELLQYEVLFHNSTDINLYRVHNFNSIGLNTAYKVLLQNSSKIIHCFALMNMRRVKETRAMPLIKKHIDQK
ncbi:hypothetical protein PHYBLDRAFT_61532 [Phycomyces blakesleeanus NRRL 1555(-)]|uniref:Uncharacterized protein n=1 Tax=Phycomyces blakesleeanus (strain ATCC 8743b / DSM 1359 / FGSC 10004 / NBRC 33097 / NRRL 1555) TaxID=763407 RepID=A0A167QYS5_PHYB8|nr:hypothetical protein PHYBLDRAFT_61532 [Phycomyces blakesleeanus NRRL 1555(-)]OAD80481.1 hypothetical protein PHYBLDRAFT_61532 [Phycomyces blakesleeanus NRRL 1555(-)]|eukprot:XP_018298521.1 hypothetical protein PHYBLDRAFT_61532 [Phycomyces blakesleeanus NRRL 1555(-)]